MYNLSLDALIFIAFLALNLVVGLSYGRKVKTLRDYAVGNKKFSTFTIVATIVATITTGSSLILYVSETYREGLSDMIAYGLGSAVSLFFVGRVGPRVGEFMSNLSLGEAMGEVYGKKVRWLTALDGIIKTIGIIAVQFKVSARLLEALFGINPVFATIVAALIVTLYSSLGGIRSVTFTDIIQFLTGVVLKKVDSLWL